ncbi:MAG: glycosyltransferase family 4 protein [Candidatus Scalindua rubra]|uniref:Mannosyltransferase B n=1 Tax=Candidatus Scalindua brodae TaxID=237368 RepID=A0A0B0EPA6_9BACT|nr:MAG: mannosyltransferase B [Candidatus Scalindua brodae]MBZ0110435.1 glycosyltransferase family 4 protein [Candidatus Scalindua rubra]TWU36269.1 GDP-mannose-dependent alpha-(1-6)-phosphatidylinositol monomannoside mannosyltransferase [Candidatus Brocadiaceae bacterium S225]
MNLLVVGADFSPYSGGIGTYTKELATSLTRKNQVIILANGIPNSKAFDHDCPFQIIRTPSLPVLRHLAFLIYIPWILRRYHIDAVLHVVWTTALISHLWYYLMPAPYFICVHGSECCDDTLTLRRRLKGYLGKWRLAALQKVKGIFPVSNYSARLVMSLGIEQSRIEVILNGVNTQRFKPVINHQKKNRQRKLLTVARLDLHKGHDRVLEALVILKAQGITPRYIIVGQGDEEGRLRKMVKILGLENQVEFTGFISGNHLPPMYNSCDIYVMASREIPGRLDLIEGFGISFLEASASGLPVVAGDSGGVSDAVQHGETGLLVNPDNPADIASAIKCLLADANFARRLGDEGRRWAEAQMSWEHVAKRMVNAMQRMM